LELSGAGFKRAPSIFFSPIRGPAFMILSSFWRLFLLGRCRWTLFSGTDFCISKTCAYPVCPFRPPPSVFGLRFFFPQLDASSVPETDSVESSPAPWIPLLFPLHLCDAQPDCLLLFSYYPLFSFGFFLCCWCFFSSPLNYLWII